MAVAPLKLVLAAMCMDENEEENDGEDLVDENGLLVFDRLPLALLMSDDDDTELLELKLPMLLPLRRPVR